MFSGYGPMMNANGIARLLGILFLVPLLVAVSVPQAAEAASSTCRSLERQLSAASRSGKSSKYASAIRKQQSELARATRRQNAAGCNGIRNLFGGAECRQLSTVIRRMRANLANLQAKAGQGNSGASRARILAALEANGCRGTSALRTVRAEPSKPKRKLATGLREQDGRVRRTISGGDRITTYSGDTYRTLCVRTCDGFYFPVSFSTTKENFARDQAACDQMCPAAEAKLYYHRVQTEESEDMVSVDGDRPYAALSTAFLYRTRGASGAESCSCQSGPRNFSVIAGVTAGDPEAQEAEREPVIPVNTWRLDPLTDPETYANLRGGFDREMQERMLQGAPSGEIAAAESRSVRVVGPAFLPDPEGAIDLRAPVPSVLQ